VTAVGDGRVPDHAHHLTAMGFFDGFGDLFFVFFFLEIDELQFNQLMRRERVVDGTVQGLREPFLAHKDYRFHLVGETPQVFSLKSFQRNLSTTFGHSLKKITEDFFCSPTCSPEG